MRNRNYERGANLERDVAARLRVAGWPVVIRSAGSHGLVDVVAVAAGQLLLIQCKTDGAMTAAARQELCDLADRVGGLPVLADRGGPRRAVRLRTFASDYRPSDVMAIP